MGSAGKENLAVEAPEEAGNIVATVPEEEEAQQASEGTQAETMAAPEANEATAERKPEETGTPQAPGGALGGAQGSSLGRYVFGSEISYNKAPPRLPGLGC